MTGRLPVLAGLFAALVLMLGLGSWLTLATLSGAVVATGFVEISSNRHVIQHVSGGEVVELLVQEGDHVEAGDVLVRFDIYELEREIFAIVAQRLGLLAEQARLVAERDNLASPRFDPEILLAREGQIFLDAQNQLFGARKVRNDQERAQLVERLDQIEKLVGGIDAQRGAIGTQLDLTLRDITIQRDMVNRGLAQSVRLASLEREQAMLEGRLGEMEANRAQALGHAAEIHLRMAELGSAQQEAAIARLAEVESALIQTEARLDVLRSRLMDRTVKAPVAGTVHDLKLSGAETVVTAGAPVMVIVPDSPDLVVSGRIDPHDISRIDLDQEVTVHLPFGVLPNQEVLSGRVTAISADILKDDRTGAGYYEVRVNIDLLQRKAIAVPTLIPGLPVQVFLRTAERSPWSYLTAPLTTYFSRALREG